MREDPQARLKSNLATEQQYHATASHITPLDTSQCSQSTQAFRRKAQFGMREVDRKLSESSLTSRHQIHVSL